MPLYALGRPGERVRQFIDASRALIPAQLLDGEVAVPIAAVVRGIISADGASIMADQEN